jgi:hypothetical protein
MQENKNNVFKILVPIIAVVVIFESVMVITNLSKNKSVIVNQPIENIVPTQSVTEQKNPIDLVFATKNKEMKIGENYTIELNMLSNINTSFDALDLYIKYDKTAFDVSGLTFGSGLPTPTFSKISDQKSLIVTNFLIAEQGGLKIVSNNVFPVMKFTVKPKKVGNFDFDISSGDINKQSITMFVQNGTSEQLPFSVNKLNVNVTK